MRPEFDERDRQILARNQTEWDKREGPRVGDYIRMKDGTLRRFTHAWPDAIQTTVGECHPCRGDSSFYFGGYMEFSGSLDRGISRDQIEPTTEQLDGPIWFFHHNEAKAHNGVNAKISCRVYRQKEG
jgi:hypothetical protein